MTTKEDNEKIATAMKGQTAARKMTAKERATSGRKDPEAAPAEVPTPSAKTVAPKPKAPRVHRVASVQVKAPKPAKSTDPVAEALAIRMRAKWAAQRVDQRLTRRENIIESTLGVAALDTDPEVASLREESRVAWALEESCFVAYKELKQAGKAVAA